MHHIRHTIALAIPASDELDRAVRAGFIARGTSLNAWCIANGVTRQTAEKALKGLRQSKLSKDLVKRLMRDALVVEQDVA